MAGFRSVKKYTDAWEAGRSFTTHFRKNYTVAAQGNMWLDNSMIGGGPPANYYAATPLTASVLNGTRGIYHGDDKSPASKWLTHWMVMATNANNVTEHMLLDYVLFYPFIDMDDLSTQVMDNTVTLPRYETGEGLKVIPVCVSASTGGGRFTFEYVNQSGVTRTSPEQDCSTTQSALATNLVCSHASTFQTLRADGPFVALDPRDSGIKQINSVTFTVSNGGLMALVLVKPLASNVIREGSVASEVEFVTNRAGPIRIYDGAYLNFINRPTIGQQSTQVTGSLSFIWDEGT